MRLIDADKLQMELLMSRQAHAQNERENQLMERDAMIVQEQPTVDAVEVVRCTDCKYGKLDMLDQGYMEPPTCEGIICTKHEGLYMDFTDYCSYGEREDGAE